MTTEDDDDDGSSKSQQQLHPRDVKVTNDRCEEAKQRLAKELDINPNDYEVDKYIDEEDNDDD